jgi:hypothetical protein
MVFHRRIISKCNERIIMTLRDLLEKANGDLDREIFFLTSPNCLDYLQAETAYIVQNKENMNDSNGESVPEGSIIIFPA